MLQIVFKNMDRSELATEAVSDRLMAVVDKFPDLQNCLISITLDMQNSPIQAGPDLFSVAVHVKSGRYRGVRLTKSASNLYIALAYTADHLLEKFNRFGDRTRVRLRNQARGVSLTVPAPSAFEADEEFEDLESPFPLERQLRS